MPSKTVRCMVSLIVDMVGASIGVAAERPAWRGPNYLYVEPASGKLLILCEKTGSVIRYDPQKGEIEAESSVGEGPFALAAHPDGRRLYVSCRRGQQVVELAADSLEVLRQFLLRGDPTGLAVSVDGKRLYVGVHLLDQVAVIDLESGVEIKRLAAGNGPEMVRFSPRQARVYVTNLLPNPAPPDQPCRSEITVIDDQAVRVLDRLILQDANVGRHIAFTSDGEAAVVAINRPKNLIPMVQVARGWVVTNGFAYIRPLINGGGEGTGSDPLAPPSAPSKGSAPVQLLIDLPNQAYADAYAVVMTPDDRKFYLSAAGADAVLAVEMAAVRQVAAEALAGEIPRYADHLGLSRRYVTARIAVGDNPQALALSPDGRWLYVGNRLDDSISVIDTSTDQVIRTLSLEDPPSPDRLLQGERFFHSAARTFQHQFSCVSCHPDLGLDGLRYDLEPDGVGRSLVDNRNMHDVRDTGPFKWAGSNPDIATQCGTRTAKWIVRTGWLTSEEVVSLADYIDSIPPVQNPYLAADGRLTPAQERGREFFARSTTKEGKLLPEPARCPFCHSGPKFTNQQLFDVGTRAPHDTAAEFDTPHLINIFESAPYLHDGRAASLEEIWTKYNLADRHGVSSDWTKQQLNDLVEYLKAIGPPQETSP